MVSEMPSVEVTIFRATVASGFDLVSMLSAVMMQARVGWESLWSPAGDDPVLLPMGSDGDGDEAVDEAPLQDCPFSRW